MTEGGMKMLALKAYYDGKMIVPFQAYSFKPSQKLLIVVDDDDDETEPELKKYSQSLSAFRAKYADFLSDKSSVSDLDTVFENVRDKTEPLRGSQETEW